MSNTNGDGRAKNFGAGTYSSAAAEFKMQYKDFPLLRGSSVANEMRESANLEGGDFNGSPSRIPAASGRLTTNASGTSMDMAGMPSNLFWEGSFKGSVHSQPKEVVDRGNIWLEESNRGLLTDRRVEAWAGFQIGDAVTDNKNVQKLARVAQQKGQQLLEKKPPPTMALFATRSATEGSDSRVTMASRYHTTVCKSLAESALEKVDTMGRDSLMSNDSSGCLATGKFIGNGLFSKQAGAYFSPGFLGGNQSEVEKPKSSTNSVLPANEFGMKGLLKNLHAEASNTGMNMLSIGVDLSMLGLDLKSPHPLYKTFNSPWDDEKEILKGREGPGKEQKFKLPTCYYTQPPVLKKDHFTKFSVGTLFYIFYNMPRDFTQVLAAIELYVRKWMYHKHLKFWFHEKDMAEALRGNEEGDYIYFDIKTWKQRTFYGANKHFMQGMLTQDEIRAIAMHGKQSKP